MREEVRKKLIRKRAFILACLYMCFNMYACVKANTPKNRNFNYKLNQSYKKDGDEAFASYLDYDIYFGSEEFLDRFDDDIKNICVIDGRCGFNPNLRICDSYRITNEEDMLNILAILLKYEEMYPSRWSRTLEGLKIEWDIHNLFYEMDILIRRSESVDLDIRDAFIFEDNIVKLFLGK